MKNIKFEGFSGILLMLFFALLSSIVMLITLQNAVIEIEAGLEDTLHQNTINSKIIRTSYNQTVKKKPEKIQAKGIYLTTNTAGGKSLGAFIERIKETELNAVVIDIKDYTGFISYDTDVDIVNELGTEKIKIDNIEEILQTLHDNDIYAIARMQVFQDPALAEKKPSWGIQNSKTGGVWKDYKGLAWLDPNIKEVWEYNIALAKDAIEKGFDEINFDYIRFPSDGPIASAVYAKNNGMSKEEVMNNFFIYLKEELKDEPAYTSADLFGMTLWHTDDFNIGQTLLGAASKFDYISPMVYPSHYPDGFLGFANPAEHPYDVIYRNLEKGSKALEKASTTTELRPWLQDFDLGAVYTKELVRAEINAAEEWDTHGWLLWNASNNYTYEALKRE